MFLVGGLALPAACGGSAGAFCDAKCDCEGCSDFDYDRCLNDYDGDVARADQRGCLDWYDDYAACVESFAGCRGTDFDDGCKDERDRWHNCVK